MEGKNRQFLWIKFRFFFIADYFHSSSVSLPELWEDKPVLCVRTQAKSDKCRKKLYMSSANRTAKETAQRKELNGSRRKKEGLINGYWDSDSEWTQWNLRKISRNTPHFIWFDVDTHTATVISRLTTRNSRKWPKAFSYAQKNREQDSKKMFEHAKKTRETSSLAADDEYGNWKSCSISVTKSQSVQQPTAQQITWKSN